MSKGERHGNREAKKPKKERPATAAAPAGPAWLTVDKLQARDASGKKKK